MTGKDMQYRRLGRSGLEVSRFGLGGWTTYGGTVKDERLVRSIILAAHEAGVNLFDIADIYAKGEAETVMGKAFRELPRHELVITSKVYFPMSDAPNDRGLSRKHVMESVEKTLRRIGTDHLDIYFCHRFDRDTPVEETARAMDDLVHQGKVLYWGTSEWTGDQLRGAHAMARHAGWYPPQVEQPQYSLLARSKLESDVLPAAEELGLGLLAWSPLASGLLTGKYDDGVPDDARLARIDWLREGLLTEQALDKVRRFKSIADGLGVSRTVLALAWAAAPAGMSSVLLGATSVAQLEENLSALQVELTSETLASLDAIFPASDDESES